MTFLIRAVLLDVDDTLLDFNKCAAASMFLAAEDCKVPLPRDAFPTFTKVNNALWKEIEAGTLTLEGLYKVRWNRVFAALGIAADGEAFEAAFLAHIAHSAETVDGAGALIAYLAKKYRVFIATNAPEEQQIERLTKANLMRGIEAVFASEAIGHAKPQKEFFLACMERMGNIAPHEIAMIGDSLTADIIGAHGMGYLTIWYDHRRCGMEKPDYADHKVSTLAEIEGIL
ncbi:MAG: HAD-IA family hydrolase [Clostridia bacterium]|nr:HAD-IA family hydrolase [Clostridia bacterium]